MRKGVRCAKTDPVVFPRDLRGSMNGSTRMGWAVSVPIVVDLLLRYCGDMDGSFPSLSNL